MPTRGGVADYRVALQVLTPEMEVVRSLGRFRARAPELLLRECAASAGQASATAGPASAAAAGLLAVMDACVCADAIARMRSALTNNLAWYKRSLSRLREEMPNAEALAREAGEHQAMLASPDACTSTFLRAWDGAGLLL